MQRIKKESMMQRGSESVTFESVRNRHAIARIADIPEAKKGVESNHVSQRN